MKSRRMTFIVVSTLLAIMPLLGCPQPNMTGQAYGGTKTDVAYSVRALTDGGAIVAGSTSSYGASITDAYLFRIDAEGNELWHKTFGGPREDMANAVRVLDDGGFVLAGQYTYGSSAGREDMYLVRTDADGEQVWAYTYGGANWDVAHDVVVLDDGFLLAGHTTSYGAGGTDAYVVRTNADGETQWAETYGGEYNEYIFGAQALDDGGFILAGTVYSDDTTNFAALLIRLDADGNEVWTQTFDGPYDDVGLGVQPLDDGGFVLAGWTTSYDANGTDGYLVRADADGEEVWHARCGGPNDDAFSAVQVLEDGRFAAAGWYAWDSDDESDNAYVVVTTADGAEDWHRTYGDLENDNAQDLDVLPDGGLILAGWTDSFTNSRAAYVVRTNAGGIATN